MDRSKLTQEQIQRAEKYGIAYVVAHEDVTKLSVEEFVEKVAATCDALVEKYVPAN